MYDAARCPHCRHEVIAYVMLAKLREERLKPRYPGYHDESPYLTSALPVRNGFTMDDGQHVNGSRR